MIWDQKVNYLYNSEEALLAAVFGQYENWKYRPLAVLADIEKKTYRLVSIR